MPTSICHVLPKSQSGLRISHQERKKAGSVAGVKQISLVEKMGNILSHDELVSALKAGYIKGKSPPRIASDFDLTGWEPHLESVSGRFGRTAGSESSVWADLEAPAEAKAVHVKEKEPEKEPEPEHAESEGETKKKADEGITVNFGEIPDLIRGILEFHQLGLKFGDKKKDEEQLMADMHYALDTYVVGIFVSAYITGVCCIFLA
jgi:hypothetical protein